MSESDDLIERLAREAGGARIEHPGGGVLIAFNPVDLQRFAELVIQTSGGPDTQRLLDALRNILDYVRSKDDLYAGGALRVIAEEALRSAGRAG